jgi:lysozyme family protein
MSNFDTALAYTIGNEGTAFTNNPNDPGRATKYGITIATLRRWRQSQNLSATTIEDVQNLTYDEAAQIYQAYYWNEIGLDQISDPRIATAIFDLGVNCGPSVAVQWAQRTVGVATDGKLGPESAAALNQCGLVQFFANFIAQAQSHYISDVIADPTQIQFLKGWLARSQKLITLMG